MRYRSLLASGAVTALAAAGLAVLAPTPAAHADPVAVDSGADWLEGRLVDGLLRGAYRDSEGDVVEYVDQGMTVEAAYTLDLAGRDEAVASIVEALAAEAENYSAPGSDVYAGSTAKLLSLVTDFGTTADARDFGGIDLVDQLEKRTADSGPSAGRISDVSQWGDYANSIGQAWAVRGLTAVGSPEADEALDFLLLQQCEAGFFRLSFTKDDTAADQTCDATQPDVPPVDVSAIVVVLLHDLAANEPELAAALDDAVDWMVGQQAADGSFDGGSATEGANSNSTGLAGWAFDVAGETGAAAAAAAWVRSLQVPGLSCDRALEGQRGAIAYDPAGYTAGVDAGIRKLTAGTWQTATVQALPALEAAPGGGDLTVTTPRFVEGGTRAEFPVAGMAPGERGCATFGRKTRTVVGDAEGTANARFKAPEKTFRRTVQAETAAQSDATVAVVLGATKLRVKARGEVARRATQRVVVRGLWKGERVVVRNDGDRVARGRADADGRFVAKFEAPRKRGVHDVKVRGQFADRAGAASYRVG